MFYYLKHGRDVGVAPSFRKKVTETSKRLYAAALKKAPIRRCWLYCAFHVGRSKPFEKRPASRSHIENPLDSVVGGQVIGNNTVFPSGCRVSALLMKDAVELLVTCDIRRGEQKVTRRTMHHAARLLRPQSLYGIHEALIPACIAFGRAKPRRRLSGRDLLDRIHVPSKTNWTARRSVHGCFSTSRSWAARHEGDQHSEGC